MLVTFARVLALVLAIVVPVQGAAAVASGQCMALGHHQDAGHDRDAHAHDGSDGHDHPADAHASGDAAGDAHCGPCTACCGSASIAGATGFSPAAERSETASFLFSSPPSGNQPDGVYRPPLSL